MRFKNWIRSVARATVSPRQPVAVPRLVLLEDRTVPATFTVDIATDVVNAGDGKTSLREAITSANAAADPDDIVFAAGLSGQTITLGGTQLDIAQPVSVTGPTGGVTLSGNNASRIFSNLAAGGTNPLTLANLTLTNGKSTEFNGGAAVLSFGVLTVTDCTFTGNTAAGGRGGAIFAAGTFKMTNSKVTGNTAAGPAGGVLFYGGSTAEVTNSTISNNTAEFGGGIATGAKTLTITNSAITGNTAKTGDGGGGFNYFGTVTVTNSTVSGNKATAGTGGGLFNRNDATAVINITNSTINGNMSAGAGGGLRGIGKSTTTVTNSTISGNTAGSFGGGIDSGGTLTLTNSTLTGNRVTTNTGGGLSAYSTDTVNNTIIAGNFKGASGTTADDVAFTINTGTNNLIGDAGTNGGLTNGTNGNIVGVAVASVLNPTLANNGGPTQTHALIAGSKAIDAGSNAKAIGTIDQRGLARIAGSAVDIGAFERSQLVGPYVVDTTADVADGNYAAGQFSLSEAILVANDIAGADKITFAAGLSGTITLTQAAVAGQQGLPAFTDDTTLVGPGADKLTITRAAGAGDFRLLTVNAGATVAINGLTITNPTPDSAVSGFSGGVFNNGGNLTLANVALTGNVANGAGAAIFNSGGSLTVTGSTITGNMAKTFGGGINSYYAATLTVSDTTISGNSAALGGGFSLGSGANLTVTNSTFKGNSSTGDGGAIANSGKQLTILNSTFTGNSSNGNNGGSAIFNGKGSTLTLTNASLSGNTGGFAGAVRNDRGTVTIAGSTISGNTSVIDAGLSNFQGTMMVTNSTVSGNSSTGNGGGVVNSGTLTLTNVTVTGNRADSDGSGKDNGGGLSNLVAGTVTLVNTIVAGNFIGKAGADASSDVSDLGTTGKIQVASSPNNLIGDAGSAGGFTNGTNGNIVGVAVNTVLNPTLADNGGPTQTHALLFNSPARGTGTTTGAPAADQRGFTRMPVPGKVSIGAFEPQLVFADPLMLPGAKVGVAFSQTLTGSAGTLPAGTTFTFSMIDPLPAGLTLSADGKLTGTPTAAGMNMFNVLVTASTGDATANLLRLTVTANAAPVAVDDKATTAFNTAVTVDVLANDTDADADTIAITAVGTAANGTAVIAGGKVTYTPNIGFSGSDTFTYTISDGNNGTATANVTVTVNSTANTPPVAADDKVNAVTATAKTINVLANDTDADGNTLTVTAVGKATNGTVSINTGGTAVSYTSNAAFVGNDTFTYTISDGQGGMATATVTVAVSAALPPNSPPVAVNDAVTTAFNTPATVSVLVNDTDADGDALTITAVSKAANGKVAINAAKAVTYTPNAAFFGTDTFTYTVSDGQGGMATGTVNVTVNQAAPNAVPVAVNDTATTPAGTATTISVLANDTDANNDPLTVSAVSKAVNGTATINAAKTVTYTPNAGFTGNDSFTYTVSDGKGGTATGTVNVTVTAGAGGVALVGFREFGVGADRGSGQATLFNPDGSARFTVTPFAGFTGGVRTAAADFNGDGVADLVVGTGPGSATRVRILDGKSQAELFTVDPFEAAFTGGVFVTTGDLNGDGMPDLIITPDEGGGPRVDVYSGKGFGKIASFFGIDDPAFRGGARASSGDINGDGRADLIVVAGFGGGPRVAGFTGQSVVAGAPVRLFGDFFAFEQTLRNGVFVTSGDIDGDGFAELIAGGGPGGGPRVTAFSGKDLLTNVQTVLANFFAGNVDNRGGVRIAVKNLDGDPRADLLSGDGTGAGSRVTGFRGRDITPTGTPPNTLSFDAFAGFNGGVFVG